MRRVLITAGDVYGRLDDNKIVSNRVRGPMFMIEGHGFIQTFTDVLGK